MRKNKLILIGAAFAVGLAFFTSCTSCENNSNTNKTTNTKNGDPNTNINSEGAQSKIDFESITVLDSVDAVFYALPSPEEILSYINNNHAAFDPKLPLNPDRGNTITAQEQKAVALGIYLADVAYLASFERTDKMVHYVVAINHLMQELNINPDFTAEQKELIYNSDFSVESLYSISRELYDVIVNYLENFEGGKELSLISIGALTESIYIATELNEDLSENKSSVLKISEQELLFADIMMMVKPYNFNLYKDMHTDLEDLEASFKQFNLKSSIKEVNSKDGVLHINGKNTTSVNQENYDNFRSKVKVFRNKLISK